MNSQPTAQRTNVDNEDDLRVVRVVGCDVSGTAYDTDGFSFNVKTECEAYKAAYCYCHCAHVHVEQDQNGWLVQVNY